MTAHVLGHADFSKNNSLFKRSQEQVGYKIVEQAATHARQIGEAVEAHGEQRVEAVLDAALSLEAQIDTFKGVNRPRYGTRGVVKKAETPSDPFRKRFSELPGEGENTPEPVDGRLPIPPQPERDLLWFIANYSPDMEDWERDIFLAVRAESFYFYPVFACQIMNEGWASYWHARLLREADFLPQNEYLDAIKTHSDVVRPHAAEQQVALSINPYHLGFSLWEKLVESQGIEVAFKAREQDDDFSFVRNYLSEDMARELNLFQYEKSKDGTVKVVESEICDLHEAILRPKYNFGAPSVSVGNVAPDGSLELIHDYETDGSGLDIERSKRVLEYVHRVWRRPVKLSTVNGDGTEHSLSRA